MKLIHHDVNNRFYLITVDEQRDMVTGRQYIKNQMKSVCSGWPHDQIRIIAMTGQWHINMWKISFTKKAEEYEVMFKMLLD